jgi:protein-S-isoprenylcysteine O-methyltransferase Ste14
MLFILGGLAMRILARKALGKQYSVHVETSKTHHMVTEGVYNVVRHPAYLGLVGLFLGIPLSEGSWGGLAIALVVGIPAIVYRIHVEEQSLREWFGKPYEQYREKTWRLIPYLW